MNPVNTTSEILELEKNFIICRTQKKAFINEMVKVTTSSGEVRYGLVTALSDNLVQVVFTVDLQGVSKDDNIQFLGDSVLVPLSPYLLNKSLHIKTLFLGESNFIPHEYSQITTPGFSPQSRVSPHQFFQTNISMIDLFMPIMRGQKIAIFASPLLDRMDLLTTLVSGQKELNQLSIMVLIGVSRETLSRYEIFFQGANQKFIIVYSLQEDSMQEQFITARVGSIIGTYFMKLGYHVIITYDELQRTASALRELSLNRNEMPGRKNYPTYLYSELAAIYERCGVFRNKEGSLTSIPLVSLEDDNFDHPVIDLTGYITEGQIVITRELIKRGFSVPIDLSTSLSRMFSAATKVTFPQHQLLSDQMYYSYAKSVEAENLLKLIGEEDVTTLTLQYVEFKKAFETVFLNQPIREARSLGISRSLCLDVLSLLPVSEISPTLITKQ